jgi:uncharacterized protein
MRGLPSPFQPHCAKVKRTVILATLLCAGISAAAVPLYVVGSESMKPARQQISPPNFDGGYEAVSFGTTSGRTLRGWFLTGTDDVGIVLLHGIRSDRTSLVERAKFLRRQGYNVLLFDLQAHGDSDGDYITFGFIEARDVEAAVKFLRETKKVSRVGIIGLSLGGAAALLADGARADAIILEAVYPTIEAAIGNRLQIKYGSVGKYLTPLLSYQLSRHSSGEAVSDRASEQHPRSSSLHRGWQGPPHIGGRYSGALRESQRAEIALDHRRCGSSGFLSQGASSI